jgi:imidazoleglycerol-phosphate dehydratase
MADQREATIERITTETQIELDIRIDGDGNSDITTGIPFFDHMLTLFARHSLMDLRVNAKGDVDVDYHHTVEDIGIVLGQALRKALGDKKGILRYGSCLLPMDETLARVAVDLSGRSFLEFRAEDRSGMIRDFPFQLVEEFMRGFANNIPGNVHVEILYGRDAHHMAEASFKGLARALDQACQVDPRRKGKLPTTKEAW